MGKEWFYWGDVRTSTRKGRSGGAKRDTPSSCMSSVFQLFDFHQFLFCLHQQVPTFKPDSFFPEDPTKLKGVEAPRNSLEMEATFMEAASFPSTVKGGETLNIPMGIQIRTSVGSGRSKVGAPKARTDDLSSEYSSSSPAGAKTPNLVARLMGLDLIPDGCSPSSSSSNHSTSNIPPSKSHPHAQLQNLKQLTQSRSSSGRNLFDTDIIGTRSLPETPRISSARRSDVDHRLSVQLNKEITGGLTRELELPSRSRRREVKQEDESGSSTHCARQIVKRVKGSVGRKVGVDITNTIRDREQRRDDDVVLLKAKKLPSKVLRRFDDESSPRKQSTPSCSPRLRLSEINKKPVPKNQLTHSPKLSPSLLSSSSSSVDTQPQSSSKVSLKPKPHELPLQEQDHHRQKNRNQKCKKIASERYVPCLKRLPQTQKEESFVRSPLANRANLSDKKCKRTPLSSELLSTSVRTIFPVKKDPPSPATKSPKKQVHDTFSSKKSPQLSSCLSHAYKQEATHPLTILEDNSIAATTTTGDGAELQYIIGILKRTGINLNSPVSYAKWYSPSHPVNPSIFQHLELSFLFATTAAGAQTKDSQMSHRCNRKLIFQLVDEILAEILKPHMNIKPWASSLFPNDHPIYGSELINIVCSKIQSFPSADCRVLEDIDALIDKDLCRPEIQRSVALEEEGEAIVAELESDLLHSLVHEMAMEVFGTAGHNMV